MNYNYQTTPVSYPANYQISAANMNYSYTQNAINAGITGSVVGAVAGAARGVYQTEKQTAGRVKGVAKIAARDSAICGVSSFAGALVAGVTGTKGVLSLAIFAAAGIGAGYMLNKALPNAGSISCEEQVEEE